MLKTMHVLRSENVNGPSAKHDEHSSFSKRESPIAHHSGQWLVIKTNTPPKRTLNGAKIKLNSLVHAWISTDATATLKLNYTEKVNKMRNILSGWEYRRLTLIGKIQVMKFKRLALSQFTYILTPLATN